jgi:hypothetical protein
MVKTLRLKGSLEMSVGGVVGIELEEEVVLEEELVVLG